MLNIKQGFMEIDEKIEESNYGSFLWTDFRINPGTATSGVVSLKQVVDSFNTEGSYEHLV